MRRIIAITIGLTAISVALAVASSTAQGRGAINVGPLGPGAFWFRLGQHGEIIRGDITFHAGRPENPAIKITMPQVRHAEWSRNAVRFSGPGAIERGGNSVRCRVLVYAVDNGHPRQTGLGDSVEDEHRRDAFGIRAIGPNDQVLFEAEGRLRAGDIVINHSN